MKLTRRFLLSVVALLNATAVAEPDSFGLGNGQDNARTISSLGTVINSYAVLTSTAAVGSTALGVSSTAGFTVGRLVLILQSGGFSAPPSGTSGPFDLTTSR